jgi:hypothetical protein
MRKDGRTAGRTPSGITRVGCTAAPDGSLQHCASVNSSTSDAMAFLFTEWIILTVLPNNALQQPAQTLSVGRRALRHGGQL